MNLVYHFLHARNTQTLEPGTVLFREGDPVGPMFVVLEGSARVIVAGHVVEMAGPGTLLGEIALIDDLPRTATIVAIERCRVLPIGRPEFDLLVREKPEFARHVMKVLVQRLRRMNELFSEMKAAQREAGEMFRSQHTRKWRAPQVDDTIPM
ncbi:MAG TPA: cyclic nucleotide-binding domain-containing protein [Burkholderiales bacterium]|jgi:CRP/FNR family transcriptional regulator, cyclic AMP receptor protein|nr:cyclic nucleotide-binding domain-containing protein [Burkholderiales bacterium]